MRLLFHILELYQAFTGRPASFVANLMFVSVPKRPFFRYSTWRTSLKCLERIISAISPICRSRKLLGHRAGLPKMRLSLARLESRPGSSGVYHGA